jgi:hypothetical protein
MEEKTRKIFRRVGAAFLLGLSFLNFGSSWGRQRAKSVPRRTQNLRKQNKEEVDAEVQQVADIAEKEAMDVINQEMRQQEQQQQLQQVAQARTQQVLKYAAIGGWGLAMGLFFTSMIFNQPFGLGKAVLSLLPGEPHIAVLSVVSEKTLWQVGEEVKVEIKLATNEEKVNYFKTAINYDPEIVELQVLEIDESKFNVLEQNNIDKEKGQVSLIARKTENGVDLKKDVIATLIFKALKPSAKTSISLLQEESVVIKTKRENNKGYNILGRVKNISFKVSNKLDETVKCEFVDIVQSRMDKKQWEWLINSAPVPLKEGNNWTHIDDKTAVLCAYSSDGGLYLLLYSDEEVGDMSIINKSTGNKVNVLNREKWSDRENYFEAITFGGGNLFKETHGIFSDLVLSFKVGESSQRWPKRGSTKFMLVK